MPIQGDLKALFLFLKYKMSINVRRSIAIEMLYGTYPIGIAINAPTKKDALDIPSLS